MRHPRSEPTPTGDSASPGRGVLDTLRMKARHPVDEFKPVLGIRATDSGAVQASVEPVLKETTDNVRQLSTRAVPIQVTRDSFVEKANATPEEIDQHARQLLDYFNESFPDGATLSARDCRRAYHELCGILWCIQPLTWTGVARRLRTLAGTTKGYRRRNGRRVVVHEFPGQVSRQPERVRDG